MTADIGSLGEFGLIAALTGGLKQGDAVRQGVGDDCAIIAVGGKELLWTCDASLEGVHFHRDWGQPEDIGWKAAVSAMSDIAAMGGRPVAALVTLALPQDLRVAYAQALYRGIVAAVEGAGAAIVGGDTTASPQGIVLDFSVIGEVVGRAVMRSGARPGDVLAYTGTLGARGAGLHALLHGIDAPDLTAAYLRPEARIAAGQWLQSRPGVHAMMDISDGLLPDARHIAEASRVGIDVAARKLPSDARLAAYWAAQGEDCAMRRLCSGEEYELLVALGPTEAPEIMEEFAARFDLPLSAAGFCNGGPAAVTVDGAPPADPGFEHFQPPREARKLP